MLLNLYSSTVYLCTLKMSIVKAINIKLYYVCKRRISKLRLNSEMSILGTWEIAPGWQIWEQLFEQNFTFFYIGLCFNIKLA